MVDMITADTEETEYDVDTTAGNWEYFVDTTEGGDSGNRGTWERLDGFFDFVDTDNDGIYDAGEVSESFWTNVAAYSDGEDGLVLNDAEDVTNRNMDVSQDALVLDSDSALSTRLFDTLNGDSVYTTTETVYYYVTLVDGDLEVRTWVGYNNAPKGLSLDADVDRAYAVSTGTKTVGDANRNYYYYADVVVFEAVSNLEDLYFVYYANTKNFNSSDVSAAYWLDTIGYNPETEAYESGLEIDTTRTSLIRYIPAFYVIDAEGNVEYRVGSTDSTGTYQGYNENNVFAAEASVGRDVYGRNYVRLSDGTYFLTEDVEIYAVTYDGRNPDYDGNSNLWVAFDVESSTITTGDRVIYATDGNNVAYVINVDESYWVDSNDVVYPILNQLYGDILLEQATPSDYEIAVAAYNDLNDLADPTSAQIQYVLDLVNKALVSDPSNDALLAMKRDLTSRLDAADDAELAEAIADKQAEMDTMAGEYVSEGAVAAALTAAKDAIAGLGTVEEVEKYDASALQAAVTAAIQSYRASELAKLKSYNKADYNTADWGQIVALQAQAKLDVELYVGKADISKVVSDCNAATDAILNAAESANKAGNTTAVENAKKVLSAYVQGKALTVSSYSKADIETAITTAINNGSVTGTVTDGLDADGNLDAAADGGKVTVTLTCGSGRIQVTDTVAVWVKK